MSVLGLMSRLRNRGVKLWLEGDALRYEAPKGAMVKELLEEVSERKTEIIRFFKEMNSEAGNIAQPILPAEREGRDIPVSFSQQSLWFYDQLMPNNPVYNIPNAIKIKGAIHINAMEAAIREIACRHEILRTTFRSSNGKPVQVIAPEPAFALEVLDLTGTPAKEGKDTLQNMLKKEAWKPFDLTHGPLWRARLFKTDEGEHVLSFTIHHIISDAWSNGIFVREFLELYGAFSGGKAISLPPLQIQFADYAFWQRQRLSTREVMEPLMEYWKKQLENPVTLELPADHTRPLVQSFEGKAGTLLIPHELSEKLKELCKSEDVTLFMLLLTAFNTLLYRYSGQEDIMIGTVVANRNRLELTGLIGFIMNTLVLRTDFSGEPEFREMLRRVKKMTLDAYAHQEMPFDILLEELKPERDLSRTPLFQVMYIHQNANDVELKAPGLAIEPMEVENSSAPFDLRLSTVETEEGILCTLDYCTALYDGATIDRMLEHYKTLLSGIAEDPSCRVCRLPVLDGGELKRILADFNSSLVPYDTGRTIHQIFEEQAAGKPDSVAVIYEDCALTYHQLNSRANQLAHYLKSLGIGPDIPVGVFLDRSVDMVVSLLGILKAGGAYVPFDPNYPGERVEFMVKDSQVRVLLTWEKFLPLIPQGEEKILCMDKEKDLIEQKSCENPVCEVTMANSAYVIYTSGSTGTPKGAVNTHLGLLNHKQWMQSAYKLTAGDRVLQKTPFSFDVSVWEFFWPLMTGACLVVAKPGGHKDPAYLLKTIVEQGITVIHFVPSMLKVFLEQEGVERCTGLRHVFCSGEALDAGLLHRYKKRLRAPLHNVYGPAECADVSTAWTCCDTGDAAAVPIGRPISNVSVYILDRYLNPVPIGHTGELCIAGINVGKGYINNPQLTSEKFVSNPFGSGREALLYRTGDLARYRPDGVIEFMGRMDFQVKIRGLRIELGEIESKLSAIDHVKEAVVVDRETEKGNKYLCAYIVGDGDLKLGGIRKALAGSLPDYMVPSHFVELDKIPLSPNGKIDRKALPDPAGKIDTGMEYEPPRNRTEEKIVEIWKKVLEIDRVGIKDNFFSLGGHSLLATALISELGREFHKNVSLQYLFQSPTVEELAALFEDSGEWEEDYEEGQL